jgi:hypothetical protein
MEVLYGRRRGLDVHKDTVAARVLIRDAGRVQKEKRVFGTTTKELLEVADRLTSHSVTRVAMESTSVYWKPVWNILEGLVDITLVNPQHFKSVPGGELKARYQGTASRSNGMGRASPCHRRLPANRRAGITMPERKSFERRAFLKPQASAREFHEQHSVVRYRKALRA